MLSGVFAVTSSWLPAKPGRSSGPLSDTISMSDASNAVNAIVSEETLGRTPVVSSATGLTGAREASRSIEYAPAAAQVMS